MSQHNYHRLVVTFALLGALVVVGIEAASRQPNVRDHLHCKMEFATEWEDMMQTADPYAVVESYFDQHGSPCQTPCRLRSPSNPALTTTLGEKASPDYEICGANNRFCFKGECVAKRFQVA